MEKGMCVSSDMKKLHTLFVVKLKNNICLVENNSFLGYVDLLGTTYSASTLATGYGAYIAQPLLRKSVEGNETTLTEEEATKIIETCLKVLFYRDARSFNKVRASPFLSIASSRFSPAIPRSDGFPFFDSYSSKSLL